MIFVLIFLPVRPIQMWRVCGKSKNGPSNEKVAKKKLLKWKYAGSAERLTLNFSDQIIDHWRNVAAIPHIVLDDWLLTLQQIAKYLGVSYLSIKTVLNWDGGKLYYVS